jgi:hypothetical protein
MTPPVLATNLANLNLYRNADGTVNVTIADGKGAINELDVAGRLGSTIPHDYVMQLVREAVLPQYRQACERIFDMVQQDDGEAFFEGEKFLKQHAPDLYNRIGRDVMRNDGGHEIEVAHLGKVREPHGKG